MVFKYLIASVLVSGAVQAVPDSDGWVPVERPQVHSESFDEELGKWVVFLKDMDGEKFFVGLPDDPVYRYFENGMELDASLGADFLRLRAEKRGEEGLQEVFEKKRQEIQALPETLLIKAKSAPDRNTLDFFYRSGENWVWERMVQTSQFLYTFHTESPEMSSETHRQFISSFEIL